MPAREGINGFVREIDEQLELAKKWRRVRLEERKYDSVRRLSILAEFLSYYVIGALQSHVRKSCFHKHISFLHHFILEVLN